jgi:hypothetical protein
LTGQAKSTNAESWGDASAHGAAAGVKGWIVKPFKGTAVLETFKKLVA